MKLVIQLLLILLAGTALSYLALTWLNRAADEPDVVALTSGEQAVLLAQSRGCVACHTLDGSRAVGPSWLGSWGQTRTFTDGSTAVIDAAYLREAMLTPGLKVVSGYDKVMLPAGLTEAEMQLIIDLIRDMTVNPAE